MKGGLGMNIKDRELYSGSLLFEIAIAMEQSERGSDAARENIVRIVRGDLTGII